MAGGSRSAHAKMLFAIICAPLLVSANGLSSGFETRILAAHNRERDSLDIEPLRWNAGLAASAQVWADHLAASGSFEHSPEDAGDPQGENLWAGTKDAFALETRVAAWVREKKYFKQGRFPQNSTTGRVEDVGHYTQLIWRRTRDVGCAEATGDEDEVLVCRYSSAGNYVGEVVY